MSKVYGNKEVLGNSECPTCKSHGRDRTGNHLLHWRNIETNEEWVHCARCGHYELVTEGNREQFSSTRKVRKTWTPEEIQAVVEEIQECPVMALTSRAIKKNVAERYGVRVGLSPTDGETPICHFYPKRRGGQITGYKVRNLEQKYFYSEGDGKECDLFGMDQAVLGDVWGGKLFIFEDELSCMSGYQSLTENSNGQYKPACVSLPDGAGSATSALVRCQSFIDSFTDIVVCMDNDAAGEEAVSKIRALLPHIQVARIPQSVRKDGKPVKDANDLLMDGRSLELNKVLRFNAVKEKPSGHSTVGECLEEALKKPEWGLDYPWPELTKMTYGLRLGEIISVGGGVANGKTLIAHQLASHLVMKHDQKVGMFMLEETVGNTLKNVAGKSAGIPFHKPDAVFSQDVLTNEIMRYDGKMFLYKNFGMNDWEDIKRVMRFWVVEYGVTYVFLDNITCLVSHLSATEINSEVSKIAVELAGMCNELHFTCFVFSHLNPPKTGAPHEEGGQVQEVQFTGSRALMRFSQLILGFERNKQADGDAKNLSMIRLLKDRNFGQSGVVPTKYDSSTGILSQRKPDEFDPDNPFECVYKQTTIDNVDEGTGEVF